MKIYERCSCGAELSIEVSESNRQGTPTWTAILENIKAWREKHNHLNVTEIERLTS